ncbi:MAG: signal peptide peptidase SppA [Treponemataceae bacterium]
MSEKFKFIKKVFSALNKTRLVIINIVFFCCIFLIFTCVAGLTDSAPKIASIEHGTVLFVQPTGFIVENERDLTLSEQLITQRESLTSLEKITKAIYGATTDRCIKSLVFDFSKCRMNLSSAYEIKSVIDKFVASGKSYYTFDTGYNLATYFLASSSERICLDPLGDIDFSGFAAETMFLGGMYDKLGIKYFVSKAGTYKGAADKFTEKSFTKEVRENYENLFGESWAYFVKTCAENRKLDQSVILNYAEEPLKILQKTNGNPIKALLDLKLITDSSTLPEFLRSLSIDENSLINFENYYTTIKPSSSRNTICIINLEGTITSGSTDFADTSLAQDWKITNKFKKAFNDPEVRGIVLRVNSGGGEVFASEVIRRVVAEARTKYKIPVVVSMTGVAASGAYWISSSADYIFANPFTITGSIGVLATIPNLAETVEKYFGITTDMIYKGAKPLSAFQEPSADDMEIIQLHISHIYDTFLQTVSSGRKLPKEKVAELASGKVYSGNQALQIGLVDKLGTLDEAIIYTAELAQLDNDYKVKTIVPDKTFLEDLIDIANKTGVSSSKLPLLKSLIDLEMLSHKNKFLLYEPLRFCE